MVRVLVTGSSGFVGARLSEGLRAAGYEVFGFDLAPPTSGPAWPEGSFAMGSVVDREAVMTFTRLTKPEIVWHLAGIAEPERYVQETDLVVDVTLRGSLNLIDAAVENGARFMFASTSEIYGKNAQIPFAEDSEVVLGPPSVPRWSYASAKLAVEHTLHGYARAGRIQFDVVRFFNLYGIGLRGRVVDKFLDAAAKNEPLNVHGSGHQTRSFTYLEDAVSALVGLTNLKQATNTSYNIGNPIEHISVAELASIVLEVTGSSSPIRYTGHYPFGADFQDVLDRMPDITRISNLIGWHPEWRLKDGLRDWQEKLRA